MNGTWIFKEKEEWAAQIQGMYCLFSAATEATQGTEPRHELWTMDNGRQSENKIQNSKCHQLSLPLLFPVLDSAQHETWGRQGWNKDIWRSTMHPPPALPQTWQKEEKRRDENMQSVKHTTQWDGCSAESPKLSKNMSVELSDRSVREISVKSEGLGTYWMVPRNLSFISMGF